jgi:hypothetical protein
MGRSDSALPNRPGISSQYLGWESVHLGSQDRGGSVLRDVVIILGIDKFFNLTNGSINSEEVSVLSSFKIGVMGSQPSFVIRSDHRTRSLLTSF